MDAVVGDDRDDSEDGNDDDDDEEFDDGEAPDVAGADRCELSGKRILYAKEVYYTPRERACFLFLKFVFLSTLTRIMELPFAIFAITTTHHMYMP